MDEPLSLREAQAALARLSEDFKRRLPERWAQIEAGWTLALGEGDARALALALHRLCGAAGGYGLAELAQSARAWERALENSPAAETEALRGAVELAIRAVAGEAEPPTRDRSL